MEAFFHQGAGCLQRADGFGQEGFGIAEHFQFYPIGSAIVAVADEFAAQARDAHGILRVKTAGGIGQEGEALGVDEFQDIAAGGFIEDAFAAYGDGDAVHTGGLMAGLHQFQGGIFAGADNQAGIDGIGADFQGAGRGGRHI